MGMQSGKEMKTHNYRTPHERRIVMTLWTGTHGLCIMKHGDVDPDEVQHGGIPVLQHGQARHGLRDFGTSYSNEQYEYCIKTG